MQPHGYHMYLDDTKRCPLSVVCAGLLGLQALYDCTGYRQIESNFYEIIKMRCGQTSNPKDW